MTVEGIQGFPIHEHVRLRPGMYLGGIDGKAIVDLVCSLIKETIKIYNNAELFFSFSINGNNDFSLEINSEVDEQLIIQEIIEKAKSDLYRFKILPHICSKLEIEGENVSLFFIDGVAQETGLPLKVSKGVIINFEVDTSLFRDTTIDYAYLSDTIFIIPVLNRRTQILIKDTRQKYLNQNYFFVPEGINYLFQRIINDILGGTSFNISEDTEINGNTYQIALGYQGWAPHPIILSFANDIPTNGGSIVDGVINGLILACKDYVRENNLIDHVIKKKKISNGLILVCSVRGGDYDMKDGNVLVSPVIKKEISKIIYQFISKHLKSNKADADKFLARFDSKSMTSIMY
ncbi:MAG: hypothetical protein ACHQD8_04190 [Chitinophagales bacterium]